MFALAKTSRRLAVALAISTGAGLLLMHGWTNRPSLFLRTTIIGLSATTAFALFEVWKAGRKQGVRSACGGERLFGHRSTRDFLSQMFRFARCRPNSDQKLVGAGCQAAE